MTNIGVAIADLCFCLPGCLLTSTIGSDIILTSLSVYIVSIGEIFNSWILQDSQCQPAFSKGGSKAWFYHTLPLLINQMLKIKGPLVAFV